MPTSFPIAQEAIPSPTCREAANPEVGKSTLVNTFFKPRQFTAPKHCPIGRLEDGVFGYPKHVGYSLSFVPLTRASGLLSNDVALQLLYKLEYNQSFLPNFGGQNRPLNM